MSKKSLKLIIWGYKDDVPIVDLLKLGRTNKPIYYLEIGSLNCILSGGNKRELAKKLKEDDLIFGSIKDCAKGMIRVI